MKKFWIIFLSIILTLLCIWFYGRYIELQFLKTKEYAIIDTNLPEDFDGLKIVHFSDLHYGRAIDKKMMTKIIKEINLIKPDIVIFSGDLIDKDASLEEKDITYLIEKLSEIQSKYASYAVLGNHDIDYDIEVIKEIYQKSHFILLQNEYDILYGKNNMPIFIGGLDSLLEGNPDIDKTMQYFEDHENISYKILIVHEPDITNDILKKDPSINLILSGHSHNGQVKLPFIRSIYTPIGSKKYYDNQYKIENTSLYISSGIGVSRINFRLFNTPSINFYRLYNETS